MAVASDAVLQQLSSVIDAYAGKHGEWDGISPDTGHLDDDHARLVITRALAAIERVAPPRSAYSAQAQALSGAEGHDLWYQAGQMVAIVRALRDDYAQGAMQSVQELVHADLFSDFVDMAVELHSKGYIGPATVLAGCVLEDHFRKLAAKHGLTVTDDKGKNKSFEMLGHELRRHGPLTEMERKSVTAWYAQRSDAAHGTFEALVDADVERMIAGVRDFIGRHPA